MCGRYGADVNASDDLNRTALMLAVERGHLPGVQTLLDGGAYVDAKDRNNRTALIRAEQRGHWSIAKLLLARGARKDDTKWP